ncbi:unnamed protein product [Didymodactylos carnosus]|uniref:DUF659 domain-containing protein n=1 Tax=Didymodactylos carnosus TaxID=1234261 RepID=A0A815WW04_9BILA|nr:unnamed protein product [Didymodactylos carnosus]CAF4411514.1 unnamed protein product [Didymodactylos carnosus]
MAITGHFASDKFEMKSTILKFLIFDSRHFSSNIGQELEKQVRELNIFDKITAIMCDGVANLKAAFRKFSRNNIEHIHCLAHKIHLILCNGLGLWVAPKIVINDVDIEEQEKNGSYKIISRIDQG